MTPLVDEEESDEEPSSFDYVIVGAGPSAMGLLYGLLSPYRDGRKPPFTIAVVERGHGPLPGQEEKTSWKIQRDPRRWYQAAHTPDSPYVVHHTSEMTGRKIDIPVGSGPGGSSNINACLCMAPLSEDLEKWPNPWKLHLLDTAKEIQGILEKNGALDFGLSGDNEVPSPLDKSIETSSRVPAMVAKGKDGRTFERKTYFSGLLEPLLERHPHLVSNLSWFRGAEAQRVLFHGTKAIGVEVQVENSFKKIMASKELILSAGAIESPALLLLSGCQSKTPGIGKNLKDQIIFPRLYFHSWRKVKKQSCNTIARTGSLKVDGSMFQVSVCDSACNEFILPGTISLWIRRKCQNRFVQTVFEYIYQVHKRILWGMIKLTPVGAILRCCCSPVLICLMHPVSSGTVEVSTTLVNSTDPIIRKKDVEVFVESGYLKESRDVELCAKAWRVLKKAPTTFDPFSGSFFRALEHLRIDWFAPFIWLLSQPYYHWCGTCSMESEFNSEWVVDANLCVRNYDSIRVCDASVFPTTISSPPGLTCSAMGLLLGRKILSKSL